MQRSKAVVMAVVLVAILTLSALVAFNWLKLPLDHPEFYLGVEVAYANMTSPDVKLMVDRVKNYTNLIVIGSPELTINQTELNETCDYIRDAGLNFIVLFTNNETYTTYNIFDWIVDAKDRYGEKFLGIYRYDEPGGHQIDTGPEILVTNATDYSDAAQKYTDYLGIIIGFYLDYANEVFTSDYALHWFDYKSKYSAVFTEFASNNSREIAIAECRGAADHFERDWGTIITWKYDGLPYIESGEELYNDMIQAYTHGANYIIVFDHPKLDTYGILKDEHFDALKKFWDYYHGNPRDFNSRKANVAYILPPDYGFGLRRADDKIWGLWEPDELSGKAWSDVNKLVQTYGFGLDIIYDEPGIVDAARNRYERLIFWNETIL